MDITNPLAETYAAQHSTPISTLLQQILDYTQANHAQPHMISGAVQGQLLQIMSSIIKPNYILEVGTFTGFSALCLAVGMQPQGQLHTIELRADDAAIAQNYFNKSIYHNNIHLHIGHALTILPTLTPQWDLVFIDADKVNYCKYYDLILPQVKQGGIILVDNVLFHGQVLEPIITGKNAIAIHAFNQKIKNDTAIQHVLLTVRDGIMIILKK